MTSLYIICLIVGGGLLLVSTLFSGSGTGEVDVDGATSTDFSGDVSAGDFNHDLSHHGPHHDVAPLKSSSPLSLTNWFSMQLVVYFMAVFGLVGTTMTFVGRGRANRVIWIAAVSGLIAGQAVHQLLRWLKRSGVGSESHSGDFVNQPARVTMTIEPGRRGEVAVKVGPGERYVAAKARRGDERFPAGEKVVIAGYAAGLAEVVSTKEHEFITEPATGGRP